MLLYNFWCCLLLIIVYTTSYLFAILEGLKNFKKHDGLLFPAIAYFRDSQTSLVVINVIYLNFNIKLLIVHIIQIRPEDKAEKSRYIQRLHFAN